MQPNEWETLQQHFEAAADLPPAEQATYLAQLQATEPALAAELEALLTADRAEDSWLERLELPAADLAPLLGQRTGEVIGPYRLVRLIGHGGMGSVYLGEREDGAFEQAVAIKLLRPGLQHAHLLDRFRVERQILARLEHPHIARLLGGGQDEGGQPYFSMEYVPGQPIDVYCAERQLSVPARLALFLQVCEALRYAHRQLVIYRDLKPSNVLVTAEGQVKLLDFGIARLMEETDTGLTQDGDRLYTPDYASPEQASGHRIGTATDVYSLGVLLYELLCGQRPLDLQGLTPAEREQRLWEETPLPPSQRLPADAPQGAALRGDLDTICLKALRKEPERRYESVEALAGDIRRHLRHEPVLARPDRWTYRTGKYLRRNRLPLSIVAAMLLLVAGLVSFYTWRLGQERDEARLAAAKSQAVTDFLIDIFDASTPYDPGSDTLRARDLLDRGAARVQTQFAGQPALQVELRGLLGELYQELGLWEAGKAQYLAGLEVQAAQLPAAGTERVHLLIRLAKLHLVNGFIPAADSLIREGLGAYGQLPDPGPAQAGELYQVMGDVFLHQRQVDSAEYYLRASLAAFEQAYEAPHEYIAVALSSLGTLYFTAHQGEPALDYMEQALAMFRELRATRQVPFREGGMLHSLGMAHYRLGQVVQADSLVAAGIATFRAQYGEVHPQLGNMLRSLSRLKSEQGQLAAAEAASREALGIYETLYGPGHPLAGKVWNDLASLKADQGAWAESESLYLKALGIQLAAGDSATVASIYSNLARLMEDQEAWAAAEAYFLQTLALDRALYRGPHVYLLDDYNRLGRLAERQGQVAKARAYFQQGIDMLEGGLDDQNRYAATAYLHYGYLLAQGGEAAGVDWLRRGLARREALSPAGSPQVGVGQRMLAEALIGLGEVAEADSLLALSVAGLEAAWGAEHMETQAAKRLRAGLGR